MANQRILFLDLARGLAVFFMILQHGMIMYAVDEGAGTPVGDFIVLAGTAPAAPVFMFIMGVFFLKARDMETVRLRGLKLMALGYVLNLLRFSIPTLLLGEYDEWGPDSPVGQFFAVDILQMAGFSLIVMSTLAEMKPRNWVLLALAVGGTAPFFWAYAPRNFILDILWGSGPNVAFPIFPWLIYPLAGMCWGRGFWGEENTDGFLNRSMAAGLVFMAVGGLCWLTIDAPWMPVGDYSRSGLHVHLFILGFVLAWLWLFHGVARVLEGGALARLLSFWSRNVTPVYVIQWLFVSWGMLVVGYQESSAWMAAGLGLAVVGLTHVVTRQYDSLRPWGY